MYIDTFDKYTPRMEFRSGSSKNHSKEKEQIALIQLVPDLFQEMIDQQGGKVVFFNGPLTRNPELRNAQSVQAKNGVTLNNVGGYYFEKTAFVGVKGRYKTRRNQVALHEYGHMFDDLIGKALFTQRISETQRYMGLVRQHPFNRDYNNRQAEHFALNFQKWFSQLRSVKAQPQNRRQEDIRAFFTNLEESIISGYSQNH